MPVDRETTSTIETANMTDRCQLPRSATVIRRALLWRHALPTLLLTILAAYAHADTDYPNIDAFCANNPERCEQMRARLDAACQKDPSTCAAKKAKLDERIGKLRAKCEANPDACAKKKEQMRKRAAEWKAKCDADPQACEEKKAELRKRLEQRREDSGT